MIIFLLILFISITIASLYLIRIGADNYNMHLHSGFMFSFLFSIAIAFLVYKAFNATNEISKYITPYNGNMSSIFTPISNIWQFESTDSKEQIELFYSKKENHKGWDIVRRLPHITLQKGNNKMTISLYKRHWGTAITYTLNQAGN